MTIIVLIIVIVHFIHASLLMKTRFNTLKSLLNFIEEERSSRYYLTMTVAGFVALAVTAFWMENNPQ
jgi:hypothetical protein